MSAADYILIAAAVVGGFVIYQVAMRARERAKVKAMLVPVTKQWDELEDV